MALTLITLALYICALAYIGTSFYRGNPVRRAPFLGLCGLGAALHLATALRMILSGDGVNLGLFHSGSLVLAVTALLLALSSLRKPLHNLFLILLPLAILALLAARFLDEGVDTAQHYTPGMALHILLSISAYGVFILAAANALTLAWETYQLRHKHLNRRTRILPPVETLETLLFELIWAGQVLLTLAIGTGFLVFDNLFAQHLVHKTFFSIAAWIVYAVLLAGRHLLGWRGATAVRLALAGFVALLLAYTGSKIVLELLLHQP